MKEKIKNKKKLINILLIIVSLVQSHWVGIVCAAGTVAAAGVMFGDKAYLVKIGNKADNLILAGKTDEAIKMLEEEVAGFLVWQEENLSNPRLSEKQLASIYYLLGEAREKAGHSKEELIETYKKAISQGCSGAVFSKLYKYLPEIEYKDTISKAINKFEGKDGSFFTDYSKFIETNSQKAFFTFLDVLFENVEDKNRYADSIYSNISVNTLWLNDFCKYCEGNEKLFDFVFRIKNNQINHHIAKEEFSQAAEVYEELIEFSKGKTDITKIQLELCKCYFSSGQHQKVLDGLDDFIRTHKATHRTLVKEAFLLKGKTYVQLGEYDKASGDFLALTIEYPETKTAADANFFIGYTYMLQGKFDLAKEALNMVVENYPKSSFASKAKLCLGRIESMTED